MKTVMVFGTFDLLHDGHLNFLKQAKDKGDKLIVVVGRDENIIKIKSKLPVHNENERLNNLKQIADKVILGEINDFYKVIEDNKPDVICLGYDQDSMKLENELKNRNLNIEVIRLKPYREDEFKSSIIRKNLKK